MGGYRNNGTIKTISSKLATDVRKENVSPTKDIDPVNGIDLIFIKLTLFLLSAYLKVTYEDHVKVLRYPKYLTGSTR